MYTMRDLCRDSGLSRSTILYYDSLELLKPVGRSAANYRLYSDESLKILKRICLYREAGVSLDDIKTLLSIPENGDTNIAILENTLSRLNRQIGDLQEKQKTIINMIKTVKSDDDADNKLVERFIDDISKQITMNDAFDIHKYLYGDDEN